MSQRSSLSICARSEEHMSELQSPCNIVCRLLIEKKTRKQEKAEPNAIKVENATTARSNDRRSCVKKGALRGVASAGLMNLSIFFLNDPATSNVYPVSLPADFPI